jgi:aspartate racemase
VVPDDLQRAEMNQIIQRLVNGQHLNKDRDMVRGIVSDLAAQGVDCVALACTDLQLLLPSSDGIPLFDTMKILAESTVNTILS